MVIIIMLTIRDSSTASYGHGRTADMAICDKTMLPPCDSDFSLLCRHYQRDYATAYSTVGCSRLAGLCV